LDLTGGGAFYSLTPRRILEDLHRDKKEIKSLLLKRRCREVTEDLGLNELKANPPSPLLGKGANKGSFCKGAGAKRLRIFNQDILRPSAEIFSANLTPNAQNDHSKSPLPPLLVCSRLTGLRARLSALTLRPQLASRFTKGGKKVAFTLAEVLVTLGIIGIVAAMTLPMLAKNYQFYVRQQQFKKAYAELSIASQKTQIDMGEGVKCFYEYTGYDMQTLNGRDIRDCNFFFVEFLKNLNIVKYCEKNAIKGKCISPDLRGAEKVFAEMHDPKDKESNEIHYLETCPGASSTTLNKYTSAYVTNSGYTIVPRYILSSGVNPTPLFLIDINAHKGPNKWGHDVFVLEFAKFKKYDPVFVLSGTTRCGVFESGGYYSRDFVNYLYGRNTNL